MKLALITAISEFSEAIKKILKSSGVKVFTYKEVMGYKDVSEDKIESNWFGSEMNETESILFYAFVEENCIEQLIIEIEKFNNEQHSHSKIHLVTLAIDKIIN